MKIEEGFTFDDLLLKPKHSTIESRSHVDLSVKLTKGMNLSLPFIPANMSDIVGKDMVLKMFSHGAMSLLHRFSPIDDQMLLIQELFHMDPTMPYFVGVSVGVKSDDYFNIDSFSGLGVKIVCVDIAHVDSTLGLRMVEYIHRNYPEMLLIAGNVAAGDAAVRVWEAGADVVKVGIGGGCFAASTRILMANGTYKNIEEVKPNELVINKDGKAVRVVKSFSTGNKKVCKVKNNSFYEDTYCTPDHRFWVGDYSSSSQESMDNKGYKNILDKMAKTTPKASKYKWKEASNLDNDTFLFPKNIDFVMPETFSFRIKSRVENNNIELKPSYDLGYIFGTFLGDGNAHCACLKRANGHSNIGSVKWRFGLKETDIVEKLEKAIFNVFGRKVYVNEEINTNTVRFYNKPFADFLNKWGKREQKHLPEYFLVSNKEYLTGIRDGLIDSDGSVESKNKDRTSFNNNSIRLIELFGVISFILDGGLPISSKRKIREGAFGSPVENFNQPYQSRLLINVGHRQTKDYFVVKKMSVDDVQLEVPVYDLEVDDDTHSFIANNMIVHNSICTTRSEAGAGVPQLSAIMDVANAKQELQSKIGRPIFFISDGGHKKSADCVKSLCFADMVMLGGMLSGTDESNGVNVSVGGKKYKSYSGSSTYKLDRVEGVKGLVESKGPVDAIIKRLSEGLQSGCSYQNCHNLAELKEDPTFVRITNAGIKESGIYGVNTRE